MTAQPLKPMNAHAREDVPTGPHMRMERKLDGWRCVGTVGPALGPEREVTLHTRALKLIESLPYINEALASFLPPRSRVDGELCDLHGATEWNRAQSLASRHAVHVPTPENPALTYVIFDLLELGGRDLTNEPLSVRREALELAMRYYAPRPPSEKVLSLIEQRESTPENLAALLADGAEGAVVKDMRSVYRPGKRVREWGKIKPDLTVDAVVTGTYAAAAGSKYDGNSVGGMTFRVTYDDGSCYDGQCAGMNDALRADLYVNAAAYVGRVIEVQHGGINEGGALRFPRFKRFREAMDKTAQEAVEPAPQAAAEPVEPVAQALAPAAPAQPVSAPARAAGARMRNYRAMKDEKLLRCAMELRSGGDAAQRSEDPERDLRVVLSLLVERKLLPEEAVA